MKVVVLVSGGKDSTCNMLKCVAHGHEIVALANLHPPQSATSDELDSFMYQSVGHELIEAYTQCMRLPLFRRAISGSSRVTSMDYAPSADDEVEDLYELLRDVMKSCQVDAVACGTILSSYQRVRVENVCQRLGLVCLAFLWQREQAALLDEMLHDGIEAVMIKSACMGLGRAQLGRSLRELRDTLHSLAKRYGVHICGEGGEYESFTLDCPLFHQRIVLDECETIVHSDDQFAPVLYHRCKRFHLEDKPALTVRSTGESRTIAAFVRRSTDAPLVAPALLSRVSSTVRRNDRFLSLSGVHVCAVDDTSVAEQVAAVFEHCFEHVRQVGWPESSILYVCLSLRDMADYAQVNAAYNELFGANPPSRTTVAVGSHNLPHGALLSISVVASCAPHTTLHVQSISEWAPACIGPYSQAQTVDESLLTLAGQIGLHPASMELVSSDLKAQFDQAERNCAAIVSTLADCDTTAARALFRHCVVYVSAAANALPELQSLVASLSCSATVATVVALPKGALVELQVLAVRRNNVQYTVDVYDAAEDRDITADFALCLAGSQTAPHIIDSVQRRNQHVTLVDKVNGSVDSGVLIVVRRSPTNQNDDDE